MTVVIVLVYLFSSKKEDVEVRDTRVVIRLMEDVGDLYSKVNTQRMDLSKIVEAYNLLATELGLDYQEEEVTTERKITPARIVKIKKTKKTKK